MNKTVVSRDVFCEKKMKEGKGTAGKKAEKGRRKREKGRGGRIGVTDGGWRRGKRQTHRKE